MSNRPLNVVTTKWGIQWAGLIALGILIWWGGPMLNFGDKAPLALTANRLLTILLVVIIWLTYHLITLTRANQTDLSLMAELSVAHEDPAKAFVTDAQNEEAAQLQQKFQVALRQLKESQTREKFSQKYIYQIPWYVIIGAPGSGKTTLLTNSGIQFPIKEKTGHTTIRGIGGTRNCNWLLSDEAIFIDTAGRYSTQDSHKTIDAAAWKRFLELLKKYRPQRPINGVMFTLSLSDLLTWSEEELGRYARTLRHRAMELYDHLGITIPIYMILTKCDLIAGFNEFFEDLDIEKRGQVWGFTFPMDPRSPLKLAPTYLEKLLNRLEKRRLSRIQQERDLSRRGLILDFPQQMDLVKPLLARFLKEAFHGSRYEPRPLLRGVYFTSGTQQGTPIDRVMSRLAGAFGLDVQKLPVFSGHVKSYFISKLIQDVILPESELAGVDRGLIRRRTLLNWGINGIVLGLATIFIGLWLTSYTHNQMALKQITGYLDHYETLQAEVSKGKSDVKLLLDRLNTVAEADKVYEQQFWWEGFGVYQGKKLKWGVERIYHKLLVFDLLELIRTRIEFHLKRYLKSSDNQADHAELLELLKIYLMLGMPERMQPAVLHDWAVLDLSTLFENGSTDQQDIQAHLDQLFQLPIDAVPLDQKLISRSRELLKNTPLYENLYSGLKSHMLQDTRYDFHLKDILGAAALSIMTTRNGQSPEELTIPGWYTLEGYREVFGKKGPELIQEAIQQNWVLGLSQDNEKLDQEKLFRKLQNLYFEDYERQWIGLLDNLKVKSVGSLNQAIHITDSLAGPETPLKPILLVFCKQTAIVYATHSEGNGTLLTGMDGKNGSAQAGSSLRQYRELRELFAPKTNKVLPMDEVLHQLSKLRDAMLKGTPNSVSNIMAQTRRQFTQLPNPLKNWLLPLTDVKII